MSTVNTKLEEVIRALRPKRNTMQWQQLQALKLEVIKFLQARFPDKHERVGEPQLIGSAAKKTDLIGASDLDLLVPFRHGFKVDAKGMKTELLRALRTHYENDSTTTVRDQRVSIGVLRSESGGSLSVDVVPGMALESKRYEDGGPEDQRFLTLYDRESNREWTTNLAIQARIIKGLCGQYKDVIRLLKAWRNKTGHPLPSYAIELIVVKAANEGPAHGNLADLLMHTLRHACGFLGTRPCILQDHGAGYTWEDFLGEEAKTQLAATWQDILDDLEHARVEALPAHFLS